MIDNIQIDKENQIYMEYRYKYFFKGGVYEAISSRNLFAFIQRARRRKIIV